jgi:hypothetical protein
MTENTSYGLPCDEYEEGWFEEEFSELFASEESYPRIEDLDRAIEDTQRMVTRPEWPANECRSSAADMFFSVYGY